MGGGGALSGGGPLFFGKGPPVLWGAGAPSLWGGAPFLRGGGLQFQGGSPPLGGPRGLGLGFELVEGRSGLKSKYQRNLSLPDSGRLRFPLILCKKGELGIGTARAWPGGAEERGK